MQNPNHTFAYFGTPSVASDTLKHLLEAGYVPSMVVTGPDMRSGRGMHLMASPVKELAQMHNIPVRTPERITPDVVTELAHYGCTYALVVAYGKILPQSLIDIFPLGILNIHYSLLPTYRGASPVEAALLHGDSITGVSIQKMVRELDAGDVLAVRKTAIEEQETTRELRPRLITLGSELLVETLPSFLAGTGHFTPQEPALVTTCGKIAKEEGELNLAGDQLTNWNKYRAYAESPGTYFFTEKNGKRIRVKIKTATFLNNTFTPLRVVPEGKNETDFSSLA